MKEDHRHVPSRRRISERLIGLCTSEQSVTALLAEDPEMAPGEAWKMLYGRERSEEEKVGGEDVKEDGDGGHEDGDELERAAKCGNWGGMTPSELFLKVYIPHECRPGGVREADGGKQIYHDALCSLEEDLARAVVSPSLMGRCGSVPLTVISV